MTRSWPGKFRSKQTTSPANSSGRRFTSRFSRVCSPVPAWPRIAPSIARPARATSATTLSCGNGDEPSAVPVVPKNARFAGVSARFDQHPVGPGDRHPGQHDRRRLVIADQRPGGLPEQALHQRRRDRQPPVRDDLLRRERASPG